MEAMVKLPGVGRKTASVVLGHVYDIAEGIAVDTHVLRVSNRLGIAKGDDPIEVERQLMAIIPRERWTRTTDLLIFHGRKICIAPASALRGVPRVRALPLAPAAGLRHGQAASRQGSAGQRRPPPERPRPGRGRRLGGTSKAQSRARDRP